MRSIPRLDERLRKVVDFFPACDLGADIGADHGRLSCDLLASGKVTRMLVTDISSLSLDKARALLTLHGMDKKAEFRIGDGLNALSSPVDAIAICGMGGEVISDILLNGKDRLCGAELILCPQTDTEILRSTLVRIGYSVKDECAVTAAGRRYVVIKAAPGLIQYDEKQLFLGPVMMIKRDKDTLDYYRWRLQVEKCVKTQQENIRAIWLTEVIRSGESK